MYQGFQKPQLNSLVAAERLHSKIVPFKTADCPRSLLLYLCVVCACRYSSMFSHARRIINPDTSLFPQTYNETVARYDTTAQDCISGAVLRT